MKEITVLWLCTSQERPVGLVKAYDEIEECWKFYVGIGHGLDPEADVREIMRCGQKYEALGFLAKLCGFDAVSDVQKEDPRWISVKERLPNGWIMVDETTNYREPEEYIVFIDGAARPTTAYCIDGKFVPLCTVESCGTPKCIGYADKVTYWMPMPEPPKDGER